jgi:hypothetical protein
MPKITRGMSVTHDNARLSPDVGCKSNTIHVQTYIDSFRCHLHVPPRPFILGGRPCQPRIGMSLSQQHIRQIHDNGGGLSTYGAGVVIG